ncbi:MAG: hypothetical protein ABW185_11970 [Sedimenticola sp.]
MKPVGLLEVRVNEDNNVHKLWKPDVLLRMGESSCKFARSYENLRGAGSSPSMT